MIQIPELKSLGTSKIDAIVT